MVDECVEDDVGESGGLTEQQKIGLGVGLGVGLFLAIVILIIVICCCSK